MPEPVEVLNAHSVLPALTMNRISRALSTSTRVPALVTPCAFSVAAVSAAAVALSTRPLAGSALYFWNAITACVVAKPYEPSGPVFQKPRSSRRCWTAAVAAPLFEPTAWSGDSAGAPASTLVGSTGAGGRPAISGAAVTTVVVVVSSTGGGVAESVLVGYVSGGTEVSVAGGTVV